MSRITFHSPNDDVDVWGSERAHMGVLTNDLALACLHPEGYGVREWLEPMVPEDSYLRHTPYVPNQAEWAQWFRTWWRAGFDESYLNVGDEKLNTWHLTLNTAIVIGSDVINFMARVHATCEIYGYVEGHNRHWLAGIIKQGVEDHVLRSAVGWEAVYKMLRESNEDPVVMSYSVTDSFPHPWVVMGYDEDKEDEMLAEWDALGVDGQWDRSMSWLRSHGVGNIDLYPGMWRDRGFGDGQSVFDLLAKVPDLMEAK